MFNRKSSDNCFLFYSDCIRKLTLKARTEQKNDLQNSYLASPLRSNECPGTYRAFLSRCRTVARFLLHLGGGDRVNGLKILLFSPKLGPYDNKEKQASLEMEIRKAEFVSSIVKAVDLCCPDWFTILMAAYPDHLLPFVSQMDEINRPLSDPQVEINGCLENEISECPGKTYQPGNMHSGD